MNENENSYVPINPHENYPDSGQTVDVPTMKVIPLKKICMTIGELPTSYLETMTYYEMLVWFINYLRDNIIPTVNANGEATEELQELFIELQNYINNFKDSIDEDVEDLEDYINNYFANLDVQEEINNRLDDYLEDGTLEHIIASYLQTQKIYNTHDEMIADASSLVDGLTVQTLGYHSLNDGGGALYKITDEESSTDYQEEIATDLYATLLIDNYVRVSYFGAVGDGETDDTDALQKAINYAEVINKPIVFESSKTYMVDTTRNFIATNSGSLIVRRYGALILKGYHVEILGNNSTVKAIVTQEDYDSDKANFGSVLVATGGSQSLDDIGEENNQNYEVQCGQHLIIHDLNIDGGAATINQTYKTSTTNHLHEAKGLVCLDEKHMFIEIYNGSVKNTFYEGITGGSKNTTIICKGVEFENSFPSCANISGGYELIEGCYFKNNYPIEMNPSYPKGTQIVRGCTFKYHYTSSDVLTYCIGASGLLSDNVNDNSTVIIENNLFDLEYDIDPHSGIFIFYKIHDLRFDNNKIIMKANNSFGAGYGGIFEIGNMNQFSLQNNYVGINYVTNLKTKELIRYKTNLVINNSIMEKNIFEVLNTLDFSGTNFSQQSDLRNAKGFTAKYHFTVPANNTTLVYRLPQMNIFNSMKLSASSFIELPNLNIYGLNSSGGFTSLIGSATNTNVGTNGVKINFDGISQNATESYYITIGTALEDPINLDMEFYQ